MIARPDFIKLNGLVKVNGFVGRIVDLAESEQSLMVKVESAKGVRRFQRPDWLEFNLAPHLWAPATVDDLLQDAEAEKRAAARSIEQIDAFVAAVMNEIASD
ncbi:MAG: hypothetical protein WAW20_12050 [Anaerolineae bacterium]